MAFAYHSWERRSGPSIRCASEAKGEHWVCVGESNGAMQSGLSILPVGLQTQSVTNACLEDDWSMHGSTQARERGTPSNFLKLSSPACSAASQELPDLAKPALKGTFYGENVRTGSLWSSYGSKLSVVAEDKPWDSSSPMCGSQDNDSSLSSLSSSEDSSLCSLEDASEVQSRYKGPLASMCSLEEALPCNNT